MERRSISFGTILATAMDSCFENGHHWYGDGSNIKSIDDVADAETCQSHCALDSRCNWFNWNYDQNPKKCNLFTKKGDKKQIDGRGGGVTGPKKCGCKEMHC